MIPFLKDVAADLVRKYGDSLKDLAIIFNNKRPEIYMKKYLAEILKKPSWSPSFYTIQDFFKQGNIEVEADKISQVVLLHECYTELLHERKKEPLSIDRFFPIAETILSDFSQIDYELVDPEAIFHDVHDLAQIEKQFQFLTEEQVSFLETFWKSFSQYGQEQIREKFIQLWKIMPLLYTRFKDTLEKQGKTTTASMYRKAALAQNNDTQLEPFKQLIFVGFNALNKAEGILFKKWQDTGKALFYFDADQYYVQDKLQEAGLFIRKNLHQFHLKNAFGDFPDELRTKGTKINIIEASGFTAQAKILDALLYKKDQEDSIAILLADENLLIPVLQSIPQGLDINITMGFPLNQSPIYGIIDIWLNVQESYLNTKSHSIPYKDIERYLTHPFIKVSDVNKKAIQQKIKENNLIQFPYEELAKYTDIYPFFRKEHHALLLIKALEELLKNIFWQQKESGQLTLIEASILTKSFQELNNLYDSVSSYASLQKAGLPFIISMIRKHFHSINAAIEGDPLKGIQMMGLLESRNLDFKEVYLLGANDGVLPKKNFANTFIPDAIRRAYGLPVLENQEALSAYLFYRLLHRTERLTLIYNNQVDDTSTGEISRFIKQLSFESKFNFNILKQQQETRTTALPIPLSIQKTDRVAETLTTYLNGNKKISATALTNYLQSPLLFFLKNIAQIKEPDLLIEDFQANKVGSILHEVMQWFYEELKQENANITADRIKGKLNQLADLCLKALSKTFYNDEHFLTFEKTNSMEKIILQIVEDYAQIILKQDINTAPFKIIELENNQDYVVDFPITVDGMEKTVKLQGIIDRIDEKGGKIRIVDYKTGSDTLEYMKNTENLFDATDSKFNKALIQTLFYTYIYEKRSGKTNVEPHLYTIRKLKEEGSLFHSQKQPLEGEKLNLLKEIFVIKLKEALEEIFNTDIPFKHNQGVILSYNEFYEEFFRTTSVANTEVES